MTAAATEAQNLLELSTALARRVRLMEVCGTHTVAIFRSGIRSLLPPNVELVSGPGCPVCVTPQSYIDAAVELCGRPGVTIATYGDMLRVPGATSSLEQSRAAGADVRVVNSARTALELARQYPGRKVVFLAVGFETTAPATAAVVAAAAREELRNFSVFACHRLVVPAMLALLAGDDAALDGFLAPGHVSVIIGTDAYEPVVARYRRPVVVAGFEPRQILTGIRSLLRQLVRGQPRVENAYSVAVRPQGNSVALALLDEVFEVADAAWRELGVIPASGLVLRDAYRDFDALTRFGLVLPADRVHATCRCGTVLTGRISPPDCPALGHPCTPLTPLGPCMVSSEGTCAAWYKYQGVAGAAGGAR